jgi:signal transduction histidine kinase
MKANSRLIGYCVVAVVCFVFSVRVAASEPKQVVVLHSYGQNFKPWSDYAKALRQELDRQSPWPLDIQDFSLITARNQDENAEIQFAGYLKALFSTRAPDIIVAFGAPAAQFVQRHRSSLFPATPMVLTAVDQRRVEQAALTGNDTVVAVRLSIPLLFGNILRLLPDTGTIAVFIGNSPNERFWINEMQRELEPLKDRVKILFYNELAFEDALKQAASLPSNSAIFWTQPQVDAAGAVHEGERSLRLLYSFAKVPIFSFDDAFFGNGVVGGPMTSVSDGARKASEVVVRILGGERPADIDTPPLDYGPAKFDWRQLQRWGISESRLPPKSEIFFRASPIWHTYRWQIALICAVIIVQTALISRLLYEQRLRRYAEVQSRQRMSELARINRFSTAGELTATIAHEINQPLGSIHANAETLELMLNSPTWDLDEIREIVADIRRDDTRASEVIHRLRSLLKKAPFEPADADLNDIVRETIDFLSALAVARQVEMRPSMTPAALPIRGDRVQLQQVILNLVVNAMDAMANMPMVARKIMISTTRFDNFAEVAISDAGPGIPSDEIKEVFEPFFTTKANGMGMGLSIARTIVEAHDGQIWAENLPSGGASIRFRLRLAPEGS